jgi:glycosyltransferase involved in cell wall biosynthesis
MRAWPAQGRSSPDGESSTETVSAGSSAGLPLTVLHVQNARIVGGIEISLVGWLRHLDLERFSPMVFCFEEADGAERAFVEYMERRKLTVHRLPWGRRRRLIAAVSRLRRTIRAHRPCIVHTHDLRPDLVGWLAARSTGCPLIASNHGWHSTWPGVGRKRRWYEALRARLLKRFDLLISVSERIHEESVRRGIDAARAVTLHTGIDLERFHPSVDRGALREAFGFGPSDIVIGNVARLHPEKGHRLLLQAFAPVSNELPHVRLLLVGDGPLYGSLKAEAHRLGIVDRVRFVGFQDDIASLFSALDVFALPSLAEGAPLVIYMAMAVGLPIVASDVAGVPDLLSHGKTGLLTPPGNLDALTEALFQLTAGRPDRRHRLGRCAREVVETDQRYSIVTSTRRLESLYTMVSRQ